MSKSVWCVKWKMSAVSGSDKGGWCSTWRGHPPSKTAWYDKTACGRIVHLRIGEAKRQPTCKDCKRNVARRRGKVVSFA